MKTVAVRWVVALVILVAASFAFAGPFKSKIVSSTSSPLMTNVPDEHFLKITNFSQVVSEEVSQTMYASLPLPFHLSVLPRFRFLRRVPRTHHQRKGSRAAEIVYRVGNPFADSKDPLILMGQAINRVPFFRS